MFFLVRFCLRFVVSCWCSGGGGGVREASSGGGFQNQMIAGMASKYIGNMLRCVAGVPALAEHAQVRCRCAGTC